MPATFFYPLRTAVLLFAFMLVQSVAYADAAGIYLIHFDFDMKDGSFQTGYASLASYRLDGLQSPSPDEVFFELGDTVYVYQVFRVIAVSLQESTEMQLIGAPLGRFKKIVKDQVKSIAVKSIQRIDSVVITDLTIEDRLWLASGVMFREDAGSDEICSYEVVGFRKRSAKVVMLLTEFRDLLTLMDGTDAEYAMALPRFTRILEKLRREHVIVFSFCSC